MEKASDYAQGSIMLTRALTQSLTVNLCVQMFPTHLDLGLLELLCIWWKHSQSTVTQTGWATLGSCA